jgi:hypothetical protein
MALAVLPIFCKPSPDPPDTLPIDTPDTTEVNLGKIFGEVGMIGKKGGFS